MALHAMRGADSAVQVHDDVVAVAGLNPLRYQKPLPQRQLAIKERPPKVGRGFP